jgi:hypothetical protein
MNCTTVLRSGSLTEAERPTYNGHNSDGIAVRDYFEALRKTDQEHSRELLAALETRLQQRFDAQEKGQVVALSAAKEAVTAALIAAEKAVEKAEVAQQRQNAGANEAKTMLTDALNRMWPSEEGKAALGQIEDKSDAAVEALRREIEARMAPIERAEQGALGRTGAFTDLRAIAVLGLSLTAIIVSHFWH